MNEYELAGIETIARGVCVVDGKILLCRAKGGSTTYLPGGHIEFGETGRQALVREIKEELGMDSSTGAFLGVVENSFLQHGKPHAEINLVYELLFLAPPSPPPSANTQQIHGNRPEGAPLQGAPIPASREDWIEFEWRPLADLGDLLPEAFRKLGQDPAARFEP
jgi:8-oxo-dGTP pyrophosphatase MutT (NUDIX family)